MSKEVEAKLNDQELSVYDFVRLQGWAGATCDQIEEALGLTHQAASARISELWHKHDLIERRGIARKTRSGRSAGVYILKGLLGADERQKKK